MYINFTILFLNTPGVMGKAPHIILTEKRIFDIDIPNDAK